MLGKYEVFTSYMNSPCSSGKKVCSGTGESTRSRRRSFRISLASAIRLLSWASVNVRSSKMGSNLVHP